MSFQNYVAQLVCVLVVVLVVGSVHAKPANYMTSTVLGFNTFSELADGLKPLDVSLKSPTSTCWGADGSLFIADTAHHIIRKNSPHGQLVLNVAGLGTQGYNGDQGNQTQFNMPTACVLTRSGDLIVVDRDNSLLRRVSQNGLVRSIGSNQFSSPSDASISSSDDIYIADTNNNVIKKLSPDGTLTIVAGGGASGFKNGASATTVQLFGPQGVFMSNSANALYISDTSAHAIRKVTFGTTNTITHIAGSSQAKQSGYTDGLAIYSYLNTPKGLYVYDNGDVLIADSGNHVIRKLFNNGTIVTFAGNGTQGFSGDGGPATKAMLNSPSGVTVNSNGEVIISDQLNNRLRKVYNNGTIETFAGTRGNFVGDGLQATHPLVKLSANAIVKSPSGHIYLSDSTNYAIRRIELDGTITSVAGVPGNSVYNGDGLATMSNLANPLGLCFLESGELIIAELNGGRGEFCDVVFIDIQSENGFQ